LYVHCDAVNCAAEAARLVGCVEELDGWMASNRLKLNVDKTHVMWVGTRQQLKKIVGAEITLKGHRIAPSTSVVCLGVHIDPKLTFAPHVNRVAAQRFHHLRQLLTIRHELSDDNARMLVHALISNRVDYCNSILQRVAVVHLRPFQSVLNAAARLIVRKRKFDHITPTLRDNLHWLPVDRRIEFKLCLLAFKCQHQMASPYLASMCVQLSADTVVVSYDQRLVMIS